MRPYEEGPDPNGDDYLEVGEIILPCDSCGASFDLKMDRYPCEC